MGVFDELDKLSILCFAGWGKSRNGSAVFFSPIGPRFGSLCKIGA